MDEKQIETNIKTMIDDNTDSPAVITLCAVLMLIHEDLKNIHKEIEQLPHRRPAGAGPM